MYCMLNVGKFVTLCTTVVFDHDGYLIYVCTLVTFVWSLTLPRSSVLSFFFIFSSILIYVVNVIAFVQQRFIQTPYVFVCSLLLLDTRE